MSHPGQPTRPALHPVPGDRYKLTPSGNRVLVLSATKVSIVAAYVARGGDTTGEQLFLTKQFVRTFGDLVPVRHADPARARNRSAEAVAI
jgi:hypothetical protein